MKLHITLDIAFDDKEAAKAVAQALEIDNGDFVSSEIVENSIRATIDADGVASAIQTLDDYLACLSVAEGASQIRSEKDDE